MMKQSTSAYYSYLMRLWLVGDESPTGWRASLENSRTGERVGFASIVELFDFLRLQTGSLPGNNADLDETNDNDKEVNR